MKVSSIPSSMSMLSNRSLLSSIELSTVLIAKSKTTEQSNQVRSRIASYEQRSTSQYAASSHHAWSRLRIMMDPYLSLRRSSRAAGDPEQLVGGAEVAAGGAEEVVVAVTIEVSRIISKGEQGGRNSVANIYTSRFSRRIRIPWRLYHFLLDN